MSEARDFEPDPTDEADRGNPTSARSTALALAPESVQVRRNAALAAAIGAAASAVAIAYLARATETGAVVDWVLAAGLGLLGIGYLAAFVDARTPLLVADGHGVRIRLGRAWRGLPWGALQRVEHTPRRDLLRDGRLVLVVRNPARLIEELDGSARRQSALSRRLYGEPFAVPLGLSTRVAGAGDGLTETLAALAGPRSTVVEVDREGAEHPEPPTGSRDGSLGAEQARAQAEPPQPPRHLQSLRRLRVWGSGLRPAVAHWITRVSGLLQRDSEEEPERAEVEPSETPSPLRESAVATRVELRVDATEPTEDEEDGRELRRPGSVSLVEDTVVWSDRIAPIAREGHAVEPLLIDDYAAEPAEDPVVGPEVSAARTRLGLTVDQLADRTRIRPHVIESIEVDDFTPCGGDFYARGHLRTLARVLGIEVAPLLTTYDQRYADAPINPRRVFEAELATGAHGPIRGTRGGLNWSVLVAAVMALVLAWSVARLIMDSPVELQAAPALNGSAGVDNGPGQTIAAPKVPVLLTAEGGGARVVVRDGTGTVAFVGNLSFGESKLLEVSPPVRVQTTDGSLTATIDGQEQGALGATGEPAQNTFAAAG
jgi:Helix-turn-helix domain